MRIRWFLGIIFANLHAMPALAVDMTPEEIQRMVDEAVTKKLAGARAEGGRWERALEEKAGQPATQYPTPTGPITDIKVERKGEEKVPLGFGSTGSGKLIYAKPFLSAPKATIGGYADIKFDSLTGPTLDNPSQQFI